MGAVIVDRARVVQSCNADKRVRAAAARGRVWRSWEGRQQQRANLPVEDKRPKVPDGGGSGVSAQRDRVPGDRVPSMPAKGGGEGVQQQRDQIPHCSDQNGGRGVSMQRVSVEQVPHIKNMPGGNGVSMQRIGSDRHGGESPFPDAHGILDGSRLRPWFRAIAERLARVIILNRSWESALTDSVLQQTPSSPKPRLACSLTRRTAPSRRTARRSGRPGCTRATRLAR